MEMIPIEPSKQSEIFKALAKAQLAFPVIKKTKTGQIGNLKYKYATLSDIIECIKKPMAANGISYSQTMLWQEGKSFLVTTLGHESGEIIQSHYPMPDASTKDPQAFGKILTYSRRYSLASTAGVEGEEDTDGIGATTNNKSTASKTPHKRSASNPTPNGNNAEDLGSWVFPKGKYEGKALKDIPMDTLDNMFNFFTEKGMDRGYAGEFLEILPKFKASKEPHRKPDQSQDQEAIHKSPSFDSEEEIPWQ